LPPFTLRLWVDAAGAVVVDTVIVAKLEQPYDHRYDTNINYGRTFLLQDHFGSRRVFADAARAADAAARAHAVNSAGLITRCNHAALAATRALAITRAQAEARRAAGRLLDDTESMMADVAVSGRLVDALRRPAVRVMAATCCILGFKPAAASAI